MGIDYGSRRVGIAFSNEDGTMAFPHSVLPNNAGLADALTELAKGERAEAIVIGASQTLGGERNPIQERIDECIQDLTLALGLPVYSESEVFSTQEAIREQGRNEMTDASAAAIILNSFLTKQRHDQLR